MRAKKWLIRPMVVAVGSCFGAMPAWGNPTGPQVINGNVQIQGLGTNQLKVTNSPNSIIHWQGFSIATGQVTQFQQQSAASAVLNRVVGPDISSIQGQLISNGRVYLINPAGIIVGPGGVIDTAGFVGSTLNMQNADFLAGKLRFEGGATAGSIVNQGLIRVGQGGNVILAAPHITNSGVIQADGGEIVLAAGQKMTIGSLKLEGIQFEIQAPTDSALNVGKLLADDGAVGVFAGTLKHSGDIRANALARNEAGHVVLRAQKDAFVDGNATISADSATGKGGTVQVLGEHVSLRDNATISASGAVAGGTILVGGDYQGQNPAVQNASRVFVAPSAVLRADATDNGDGGRIIVWADKSTQFYGALSARGGPRGGNGGFAEVSGKENLIFAGSADLGAPYGRQGQLLLDPLDLYVDIFGGLNTDVIDEATDLPLNAITVSPTTLANLNADVRLFASRYMRFGSPVTLNAGRSLTATVATYTPELHATGVVEGTPPNRLDIAANIATSGAGVSLTAPSIRTFETAPGVAPVVATDGGNVTLMSSGLISGNTVAGRLAILAGTGAVSITSTANAIQIGAATAGSVTANGAFGITTGALTTTGPVMLDSASGAIQTGTVSSAGGNVRMTSNASTVTTQQVLAGGGEVNLKGTGVTSTLINTSGLVMLEATEGSVAATVDNASSVVASSRRVLNANVTTDITSSISATSALNATKITATHTACFAVGACPSATVNITANNATGVNLGEISAAAATSTNNNRTAPVNVLATAGSIRALALPAGVTSHLTGETVSLRATLAGASIGAAGAAVTLAPARQLTFEARGNFTAQVNGASGPNRLDATLGVAAAAATYGGSLTGGGINLVVANTTDQNTVQLTDLTISEVGAGGFKNVIRNNVPAVNLTVPNGALIGQSITTPEGGTVATGSAALPVVITANGNLTVNNYTRQGAANVDSLAKVTTFTSTTGSVTLGSIAGNKDTINVTAQGNINIAAGSVATAGTVNVTSQLGNITVGSIDTTSGTGDVNLTANALTVTEGHIFALSASAAREVNAGGVVTLRGQRMGDATNALNLAGSAVRLFTRSATSRIGDTIPLTAATTDLGIDTSAGQAAGFLVDTLTTGLVNLSVKSPPSGGTVTSQGVNYAFGPAFAPGATPVHFADGSLKFEILSGDLTVGTAIRLLGNSTLELKAPGGSISGAGQSLDARNITLSAATSGTGTARVEFTTIGANDPVAALNVVAGFRNDNFGTSRDASAGLGNITTTTGGNVTVRTFAGNLSTGSIGQTNAAGTVSLTADRIGFGNGSSGRIDTGSITANTAINLLGGKRATPDAINIAGSLNAPTISANRVDGNAQNADLNVTGSIGSVTNLTGDNLTQFVIGGGITANAANPASINVRAGRIQLGGAVTAAKEGSSVSLAATAGSLVLGPAGAGEITAGNGSTITLSHSPGVIDPLLFAKLDAGTTGTVNITTNATSTGVRQDGGTGIRAQTVTFTIADTGNITDMAGTGPILLNSVKALAITSGGDIRLDNQGSALDSFAFLRNGDGTQVFSLANLTGQTITIGSAASPSIVATSTAGSPLDFSFTNTPGGITLASQMLTRGGTVSLQARGALDASPGIDTTAATPAGTRGAVTLITSADASQITTGAISTPPTATTDIEVPRAIALAANGTNSDIVVNGNLDTGVNGGAIRISAANGNITGTGVIKSQSPDSVFVTTSNGDIGTNVQRLQVDSPNAHLNASGDVYARLTNSVAGATRTNLDLSAGNGFDVTSALPFNTLSVATRASGTGPLSVTVDGNPQTYAVSRPVLDLFGNVLAAGSTLEVSTATGAGANNPVRTDFMALDGDLLVRGGATLTAGNLKLDAPTGMLSLQGNNASPLSLTNAVSQTFSASGDIDVRSKVTLQTGEQTVSSSSGNISFTGGDQANEAITLTASVRQRIGTSSNSGGNVVAQAGSANSTGVTFQFNGTANPGVDADNAEQQIEARGQVQLLGGSGSLAQVLVTGNQRQLVRAGNNAGAGTVLLRGGSGANAGVSIISSGAMKQQIGENRVFCCFPPYRSSTPNVTLEGGSGTGSSVTITANGEQVIQSKGGTVLLMGGSAMDTQATIEATGAGPLTQTLNGAANLMLTAGAGPGALVRIRSLNSAQNISASTAIALTANAAGNNAATITGVGQTIAGGNLTLAASGTAEARLESSAGQTVTANALTLTAAAASAQILAQGIQSITAGTTTLTGGTSAGAVAMISTDAAANLGVAEQTLSVGNLTLSGGSAANAFARIRATNGDQRFTNFSSLILNGGSATGAFASIDAVNATQRLDRVGNITLNAGNIVGPVANAGAIIEGQSQQICPNGCGTITLNGRAGVAGAGNSSDALIRNLAGSQSVTPTQIVINGGTQFSAAGIVNMGTGQQTVTAGNGIALTGNAVGAGAQADVFIRNVPITQQSITANNGVVSLANTGTGLSTISSGGLQNFNALSVAVATASSGSSTITAGAEQRFTARFIDVMTAAAATGDAKITAAGNQWIHTTTGATAPVGGGSIGVRALGSGTASIESGARQLLEIDYSEFFQTTPAVPGSLVIGATNATGRSLVQGVDQRIYARTIGVQGGSAANATAKLTGTNAQTISVFDGPVNIFAGTGSGATAGIDPLTQTIVANNSAVGGNAIDIRGTTGAGGAGASVTATNAQTILATRGNIAVIGNVGPALIQTTNGPQTIGASEGLFVTAGGSAAAQIMGAGAQTINFGTLILAANSASAMISTTALQTLTGNALELTGGGGANASASIVTSGNQVFNVSAATLTGGGGSDAFARIQADGTQSLAFGTLMMTAGNAAGAFAKIDTPSTQTLTAGAGGIVLNASGSAEALIQGLSQRLLCGAACGNLTLQGNAGAGNASMVNLAGDQTINAASISLLGGQSAFTGIRNQGAAQTVAASGGILLQSHASAAGNASVAIDNAPASAQTITATQDIRLISSGAGTVAVTSGGTQSIDARGLDVQTTASAPGGANASVLSATEQTIRTRGSLQAEPGVGMRVASRSTGSAKVVAGGNQMINVDGNQLLIGRLSFGPPGPGNSASGSPAAGDSLVLATSEVADPNQTVTAGSIYLQGPSGNLRVSKLSGDGVQTLNFGRLHIIGGSGQDAFAVVDPTTQTIMGTSDILLQGGSGVNADALINATGPQTVTTTGGSITLIGGAGLGADALIVTVSPFQTVSAANGVILVQGPATGGIAGLQQGTSLVPSQIAANSLTSEIIREQDHLEDVREDLREEGGPRSGEGGAPQKASLCS